MIPLCEKLAQVEEKFHSQLVCPTVFSIIKCGSDITVGGGLGVLQKNIFGFNGVKSCNSRHTRHGNALSKTQG